MEPLTIGLAVFGIGSLIALSKSKTTNPLEKEVKDKIKDASLINVPSLDKWQSVWYNNEEYLVAPKYIAPVGIGEGAGISRAYNSILPSPGLVDAIWQQADLKLAPSPRGANSNPPNDFTRTMNSPETNIDQLAIIQKQIESSGNEDYKLLAGTHKDIVMGKAPDGRDVIGIYGWHQLNGKPIQGFMWGHSLDWKDYSQGLRLVRKT